METESDMPREWVIDGYNGFESLRLRQTERERPGPTDVRLKIEAFALNWGDADLMNNQYSFSFSSFPARVGIEAAGIVEAVGEDVEGVDIGERYSTLQYFYDMRGVSADTTLIDQAYITKAPENLSAVEAASVWMQYLTAFYAIVDIAEAAPGVNIFVPAGTSTAGSAAIRIGKLKGATIIATTRSEANRHYLLDKGADAVFVDDGADITSFLREVTAGVGIHTSFDPVGGTFMERYANAMAPGGKMLMYGLLSGSFQSPPVVHMYQNNLWLNAYSVFNHVEDPIARARGVDFVYSALKTGELTADIDRVFPMDAYIEAWRYLRGERGSYGKVVIETGL